MTIQEASIEGPESLYLANSSYLLDKIEEEQLKDIFP